MSAKIRLIASFASVLAAVAGCGSPEGGATPPDHTAVFPIAYEDVAQPQEGAMLFVDPGGGTVVEGIRRVGEMFMGVPRQFPICRIPNGMCFNDQKSMLPVLLSGDISENPTQFADLGVTVSRRGNGGQAGCSLFVLSKNDGLASQTYTACSGVGVTEVIVFKKDKVVDHYILRSAYGIFGPIEDSKY